MKELSIWPRLWPWAEVDVLSAAKNGTPKFASLIQSDVKKKGGEYLKTIFSLFYLRSSKSEQMEKGDQRSEVGDQGKTCNSLNFLTPDRSPSLHFERGSTVIL